MKTSHSASNPKAKNTTRSFTTSWKNPCHTPKCSSAFIGQTETASLINTHVPMLPSASIHIPMPKLANAKNDPTATAASERKRRLLLYVISLRIV